MKTSKTLCLALSMAICLWAMSSCKREDLPSGSVTNMIKTTVSTANQDTKSSYEIKEDLAQTILLDEEEELYLQEFVSDNFSQPFEDTDLLTKGEVITTDNVINETFGMEGFLDNFGEIDCVEGAWPQVYDGSKYIKLSDDYYIKGGTSTYSTSSSTWTLKDGGNMEYPWLNNIKFTFWSYLPKQHNGTFAYGTTGSRSNMSISNFVNPTSSSAQEDLLVAFNKHEYPTDGEKVEILFRHALADICFDVTSISKYNLTVKNITINNANSKGNCAVSSASLYLKENSRDKVEAGFSWTSDSKNNFTMTDASDHFFMIPQSYSGSITISLSNGKTFTTPLSTTWQAGKYYKYKLIYNGLEISVDDTVEGNVKKNVVIKSTSASTVKCYIRALIIGNWYQNLGTASEPILAPWSVSDGTFNPALPKTAGASVNNWVLGSDGYYYYKYPVYPNTETGVKENGSGTADKLFSTYTTGDAPVSGAYLNLSIMAQAVKWDADKATVTQAWGTTAADYLSKTDKP